MSGLVDIMTSYIRFVRMFLVRICALIFRLPLKQHVLMKCIHLSDWRYLAILSYQKLLILSAVAVHNIGANIGYVPIGETTTRQFTKIWEMATLRYNPDLLYPYYKTYVTFLYLTVRPLRFQFLLFCPSLYFS